MLTAERRPGLGRRSAREDRFYPPTSTSTVTWPPGVLADRRRGANASPTARLGDRLPTARRWRVPRVSYLNTRDCLCDLTFRYPSWSYGSINLDNDGRGQSNELSTTTRTDVYRRTRHDRRVYFEERNTIVLDLSKFRSIFSFCVESRVFQTIV